MFCPIEKNALTFELPAFRNHKKQLMKTRNLRLAMMTSAFALSLLTTGCQKTLYKSETQKVRTGGTVETKETTVTENPDGTITRTDEKRTTKP